jgi:hypothetical protein
MKSSSSRVFLSSLALVAIAAAPAGMAQSSNPTTIQLNYGGSGTCNFTTDSVNISGINAGVISATGQFDPNSNCPAGGATGTASLNLSATPSTVVANTTPVSVSWNAVADVCRYDGSTLPGAVTGWATSGYACIGSTACGTGGNLSFTPTTNGTYNFSLTCYSGAHDTQLQTSVVKSASVSVTGGEAGEDQCVAPAPLTRATTGRISTSANGNAKTVDVTKWDNVFGYNIITGTSQAWPGVYNDNLKITISKNQYWSMKFTVGPNYPYFDTTTHSPQGNWKTNDTLTSNGVLWTVSITKDCGDFSQPAVGDPDRACFAQYTNLDGANLGWHVNPVGTNDVGYCNLRRGETYYLNIIAAELGTPKVSSCPGSSCANNFQHGGNFNGTQGQ